jgi:two-component system response regulator PilR (NtrC family)
MWHQSLNDQTGNQTSDQTDKKKGRILILDRDECTCDFLSSIIKLIGFEFEMVNTVDQAIELLEKSVFDLLITDLHLPNSQEFLQASLEKHPDLQTIVMVHQRQVFFEALRLPGAAFIQKPFNFDDIVKKIHQAIHHRNLQQVEHHIQRLRQEIFRL